MKKIIVFLVIVHSIISCDPEYDWQGVEFSYVEVNGWENDNFQIKTHFEIIELSNEQYFKWYRNDSLKLEGYITEFLEKEAESHATYSLVKFSNGYYTQLKKIIIDNSIVLDTKWPRQSKDSLSMFEYERLEAY